MVEDAAAREALMTNYTDSLLGLTSNILAVEETWLGLKQVGRALLVSGR